MQSPWKYIKSTQVFSISSHYDLSHMKKLSLIPLTLIVIVGVVWASSIITPDKPWFPSLPDSPGTIGYSLTHFFTPTGDALDTEKLGGISATGYLKSTDSLCTNPWYVWKSIRPDGTAECQAQSMNLLAIGSFSELYPWVEISKNNGSTWSPANTTDILYNWDMIRTNGTGTGTIDFIADDSLLRLDTNTLVQLETGDLDGNTVAQAIVNNGSLWWRVLTSTGINIGGGGVVAWVRGTSVRVIASSPTLADIAIIDTANTTPATLRNQAWNEIQLTPGKKITTNTPLDIGSILSIDLTTDLTDTTRAESRWTQKNLKLDLDYLLTLSGSSIKTPQIRIDAEIASLSMSWTSTDQKFGEMACSEYGTWLMLWRPLLKELVTRKDACIYAIADYVNAGKWLYFGTQKHINPTEESKIVDPETLDDLKDRWMLTSWTSSQINDRIRISNITELMGRLEWSTNCPPWDGREFCTILKNARDSWWTEIAVNTESSSTTISTKYYDFKADRWSQWVYPQWVWFRKSSETKFSQDQAITNQQYISYPISEIGNLAGKTIEIEFADGIPDGNSWLTPNLGNTIIDFWSNLRITKNSIWVWICKYPSNPGGVICDKSNASPFLIKPNPITSKIVIEINISLSWVSRFIVWNSLDTSWKQPIKRIIKSLKINK